MISQSIVNYRNPASLGNKFRQKRFEFFERCIRDMDRPIKILDIGGTELFWRNRGFADNPDYKIHLLNLFEENTTSSNITSAIGDAVDLSEYDDLSFDVVFSNSVIEHLFSFDNQKKMADEIIRLGKSYFIQTPNKYFPIEPHFLFPLFQFFPSWLKLLILTKTKLIKGQKRNMEDAKSSIDEIQLLSKKQLRQLFPNASIYKERFLGLNKSFIMHSFKK